MLYRVSTNLGPGPGPFQEENLQSGPTYAWDVESNRQNHHRHYTIDSGQTVENFVVSKICNSPITANGAQFW